MAGKNTAPALGLRESLIGFALAAAEAAMLTAISDLPKWVLCLSVVLQLAVAGSLYFHWYFPQVNLGWMFASLFLVVNLLIFACGIYVSSVDPRLTPLVANSGFFRDLSTDKPGTFTMICFPFDSASPSSCAIALRYQTALGKYWRPGAIIFDPSLPDFKGISLLTQSKEPSNSALAIRERFRSVGIEPLFNTADPALLKLGHDDFAVWIGGKP